MALGEALNQEAVRNYRQRCAISVLLDQLDTDDATALTSALAQPNTFSNGAIERALAAEGHAHIKSYTVMRHRNGSCSCGTR
jgi:tetrahydromethanopterin S-methyltransferase subunit A